MGILACVAVFVTTSVLTKTFNKKIAEYDKLIESDDSAYLNYKLNSLYKLIDEKFLFEYDQEDIEEGIYKGVLAALKDPYSAYFTKEEFEAYMEDTSGVYYGIGVQVSQNASTGVITVTKVFPDCPGDEAGMLPGDIVIKVAGTDVAEMDLEAVVKLIKGEAGTYVDIEVYREQIKDYVTLKVERREVKTTTVEHEMLEDDIGYIYLSGFEKPTAKDFARALEDLKSKNMKGLVLDVRGNPGGLLTSVLDILGNILPEGLIVYTEDKDGNRQEYKCEGKNELKVPMVVLINGSSASASEILAGAIKDYQKGTLVGTTTYGKGIVQSTFGMKDGSAVKVTISKYYTPKGINIHGVGVSPDVEVELNEELKYQAVVSKEEDNQLQEGLKVLKEAIKNGK